MLLTEYTPERKNTLNKLNISHVEFPFGLKLLWCDSLTDADADRLITAQAHSHTFYEIFLVFQGEITYFCNEETITLREGEGLLLAPGMSHCFLNGSESFLRSSIAFAVPPQSELTGVFSPEVPVRFPVSAVLREHMNRLLLQCDQKTIFTVQLAAGRLLELLYEITQLMQLTLPPLKEDPADPRYYVATQYIDRHRCRAITVEEVAKECCLSVKQLNRIFRDSCGRSIYEYITRERLLYAKYQLQRTERSIKDISFSMGFENESSFTAFFKRHAGIAPSVYRNQTPEAFQSMSQKDN